MQAIWQDLKYAVRTLRKSPTFTIAAVFALALGIGANTAIFSVINAILLNPLPLKALKDPDRLVMIWEKNPSLTLFIAQRMPVRPKNYRMWKKESQSFEGMAIYSMGSFNLTSESDAGGRKPEQVDAATASSDFFPVLGIQPRLGRNFTAAEMQPGKNHVALLSDELYRSRFQSDPHILTKTVRADGVNYQIIGVLPPGFQLPAMWEGFDQKKPKMWVPANLTPGNAADGQMTYYAYGRLKPGVSLDQARAEMTVIAKRLEQADSNNIGFGINVFPVALEDVGPDLRRSLQVLQVAVGFVLLIACANVANLLLTRAVGREKEIAVRTALGATRRRIVGQMLSESLLLSALGGLAGLTIAFWVLRLLSFFAPKDTHGFHELRIDPLVLGFTVLATVLSGSLFGLAPSFHALGQSVNAALSRGARSVGGTSNGLRNALVIAEIALSLILLVGAGLMIRSLASLMATDLGFQVDHLLTMRISIPDSKYTTPEQTAAFNDRLLDAIRQLPGVRAASLTTALPMQSISESSYKLEGATYKQGQEPVGDWARTTDGYFESLGLKVLRGRTFTRQDALSKEPSVAVVNEAFAKANWPHQDPLGKVLIFGDEQGKDAHYTIIGVVGNERQLGPDSEIHGQFYVPGHHLSSMIVLVRAVGDPLAMASAVERQVWNIDKEQPVSDVHAMADVLHDWVAPRRFNMTVLLNFAGVALILAAVGLYSVLAYSVSLRTREIGIRVALGAEPRNISQFVVGQGFKLTLIGAAVGLAGAFLLTRFMQSLIFGVSTTDPYTFALVTVGLIAVSLLASYLPARRAARIDPIEALRVE